MVHIDPSWKLGSRTRLKLTSDGRLPGQKKSPNVPKADCHIFLDYGSTRMKVGLLWKSEADQHAKQIENGNLVDLSNFHLKFPGPNRDRATDLPPSAVRIVDVGHGSSNLKAAIAWKGQRVPEEGKPNSYLTHFKYQMRSDDCSPLRNISDSELVELEKTFGNDDIANYETIMTMVLTSLLEEIKHHATIKGPSFSLASVSWTCTTPPPFEDNIARQFQYAVETATKNSGLDLIYYRPRLNPFPFENLQESYCAGVSYAWWQKGKRLSAGIETELEEQIVVVIDGGGMSTHCGACRINERSTEQTEFWVDYLPRGQETLFNTISTELSMANQGKPISQDGFINMMLRATIGEKARGIAEISSIDEANVAEILVKGYKNHAEALADWTQAHLAEWGKKRVAEGGSIDVTIAFSGGFMLDTTLVELLQFRLRQISSQNLTFDNVAEGSFNVLHGAMIHHLNRGRRENEAVFEHSYGHYGIQYDHLKEGKDSGKPRMTIKSVSPR